MSAVAESSGGTGVPHGPCTGSLHNGELCESEKSTLASCMWEVERDLEEYVK